MIQPSTNEWLDSVLRSVQTRTSYTVISKNNKGSDHCVAVRRVPVWARIRFQRVMPRLPPVRSACSLARISLAARVWIATEIHWAW
eukprot:465479-Prymnesium_polylepis.2